MLSMYSIYVPFTVMQRSWAEKALLKRHRRLSLGFWLQQIRYVQKVNFEYP